MKVRGINGSVFFDKNDMAWKAKLDGKLIEAEWNSQGAAMAGVFVEQRRIEAKRQKEEGAS